MQRDGRPDDTIYPDLTRAGGACIDVLMAEQEAVQRAAQALLDALKKAAPMEHDYAPSHFNRMFVLHQYAVGQAETIRDHARKRFDYLAERMIVPAPTTDTLEPHELQWLQVASECGYENGFNSTPTDALRALEKRRYIERDGSTVNQYTHWRITDVGQAAYETITKPRGG